MRKRRRYNIDLCAHMAECEANYLRLNKLMPKLRETDDRRFDVTLGDSAATVRFEVTERSPYTTVVAIHQVVDVDRFPTLSMTVRLYHDAKSAEVIEVQKQRGFAAVYDYPNSQMRQRDEKVQINRFLSEFLSLCLSHGVANEEPLAVLTS